MITNRLKSDITKFSSFSKEGFDLLLSSAKQTELSTGQYLLNNGQICNDLYFLENGFLRTFIYKDGDEVNMNFTFEGNFLSDLKSLKKQQPTNLNIIAEEKSIVTHFDKDKLYYLINQSSEIESFGMRILAHLFMENNEHLDFFRLKTPNERYQHLIKNDPRFIQRVSVTKLSSYIGVARETLSRIRKNTV